MAPIPTRILLLALALALALTGPGFCEESKSPGSASEAGVASTTNSMEALDSKRKLAIGDLVSFRVVEERNPISVPLQVLDSGELEFPLIGRVAAKDKTCRALAEEVKGLLEREYFNHATVIIGLNMVTHQSRGVIYLMGPVVKQGPMDIPIDDHGPFTLSKAILRAGGFGDFANGHKVKLIRKSKVEGKPEPATFYDVDKVLKGNQGPDPELEPDDIIIVPEKFLNFG